MVWTRAVCCFTEQAYSIFEIGRKGVIAEVKDRPLLLMLAVGTHPLFDKAVLLSGVNSPS